MKKLMAIVASFMAVGVYAADVAWTGADATDSTDWFAPDNWSGAAVPAAGDAVTIPSGVANMPILAASTPALDSITISGTLTFTNWTTCLNATTVTISSGGIVTCAGPFTDDDMSNRVWIACTDLTLASGGKIDVSEKGYGGGKGPGKGYVASNNGAGGAHGGWGGAFNHYSEAQANVAYDSASEPILPGSGGNGHPAGGAIRIDASGLVTLGGNLLANGQNTANSDYRTGGAGGSILVNCNRIVAAAGVRISAEGGSIAGKNYPTSNMRLGGAGGRIALRYNPEYQTASDIAGAFISAAAGYDMWVKGTSTRQYPASRYPANYIDGGAAQDGTLWFPDSKVFGVNLAYLGTHFAGRLANVSSLEVDGDLSITNRLGFANEGVSLTVTGNLSVEGNFGKLMLGDTEQTSNRARKYANGSSPVALTVGGNFSLSDGARADIYAGMTNGTGAVGANVTVGGAFTVGENSTVYLYSHPINGGSPRITAASCSIAETALVSADSFGFESVRSSKSNGTGPGAGIKIGTSGETTGASHGGLGGNADASKIYDDPIYPTLPGSSGGTSASIGKTIRLALAGGGVVHIKTTGAFALDGSVSANGILSGAGNKYDFRFGGGSGGSILLEAKKFTFGSTAQLSADGGSTTATRGCAGGGGRIALIEGEEYSPEVKPSRLTILESMPDSFLGTATVAGGTYGGDGSFEDSAPGEDGTIRFVTVNSGSGLAIFVR